MKRISSKEKVRLPLGEIVHPVKLQQYTEAKTAGGGRTKTWTDQKSMRIGIHTLRGYEKMQAMKVSASLNHIFYAWFDSDIKEGKRFQDQTDTSIYYQIKSAYDIDGKRKVMEIWVEEEIIDEV